MSHELCSPAAIMSDFMTKTQVNGRAIQANTQLFSAWFGPAWETAQLQQLEQSAHENAALLAKTAASFQHVGLLPLVKVGQDIGTLDGIATDSVNSYQLAAWVNGQRQEHDFENVALIDVPALAHHSLLKFTAQGVPRPMYLQLGSVLFAHNVSLPRV